MVMSPPTKNVMSLMYLHHTSDPFSQPDRRLSCPILNLKSSSLLLQRICCYYQLKMKFLSAVLLAYFFGTAVKVEGFLVSKAVNNARTGGAKSMLSMVADDAKVILVTGSSRGLGKSIALDLGAHGQKVVVNYVSEGSKAGADATVEEIKALGGDAIAVQADSKLCRLYCVM